MCTLERDAIICGSVNSTITLMNLWRILTTLSFSFYLPGYTLGTENGEPSLNSRHMVDFRFRVTIMFLRNDSPLCFLGSRPGAPDNRVYILGIRRLQEQAGQVSEARHARAPNAQPILADVDLTTWWRGGQCSFWSAIGAEVFQQQSKQLSSAHLYTCQTMTSVGWPARCRAEDQGHLPHRAWGHIFDE